MKVSTWKNEYWYLLACGRGGVGYDSVASGKPFHFSRPVSLSIEQVDSPFSFLPELIGLQRLTAANKKWAKEIR
jgi:hypothetical protein